LGSFGSLDRRRGAESAGGLAPGAAGVVCWRNFSPAGVVWESVRPKPESAEWARPPAAGLESLLEKLDEENPMISRKTFACLLLTGFAAVALSAQTADELVEKNIQAKGGRDKLNAVKTLRLSGKMTMGQGMEAPVVMEMAPPAHKVRMEFTFQGMTGVRAYDGAAGWQVMPFMGKTDPEALAADELKEMKQDADFQGPLFDYKSKGNKVEYLGKGDLEGTPVQKLKLTEKDGDVTTIYLDADSFLELKEETTRTIRGQATDLETTLGNYQKVEGLTLPYTIESKAKGMPGSQVISVSKVEINTDVPASRFEMPKVEKKKETPKEAAPPKP
jgi:outer membrane lipoprotein-sorting protein